MNRNSNPSPSNSLACTPRSMDRIHDLAPRQAQLLRSVAIQRFWSRAYASLRQTLLHSRSTGTGGVLPRATNPHCNTGA